MELTKTQQYRKITKPLLERQRRARINNCLNQLKDLIIDCLKNDNEQIVRLEKADILEYTVEYLRKTKSEKSYQISKENFRDGYIYAANEVSKAMASAKDIHISLGTKLMTHLGHKLNYLQSVKVAEQSTRSYSPLNIETDKIDYPVSKFADFSPVSSGYYSDSSSSSPVCDDNNFENSVNIIWRPW